MNQFKTEEDLEMATVPLIKKHFKYWSFQIPNYNRVIDFGGMTKDDKFIGIEYKLSDWKTAIWQAVRHRLIFDYLYILLPFKTISVNLCKEAKKCGIGILLFNSAFGDSVDVVIKPKRQWYLWTPKRKIIYRWIKEVPIHKRQFSEKELEEIRQKISNFNRVE